MYRQDRPFADLVKVDELSDLHARIVGRRFYNDKEGEDEVFEVIRVANPELGVKGKEIVVRRWHKHTHAKGEIGKMLLKPDGSISSPSFGKGYKLDIMKRYTIDHGVLVKGAPTTQTTAQHTLETVSIPAE
jgi:hypothetical protein